MKLLFDVFPVLLFFIAFKVYGIYAATAVAMGASFAQIGYLWLRGRKIDKMLWVSVGVITFFGGATLLLGNETFIKWKPTVLYWLFATALIVGHLVFRKNLVRSMMEHQVTLPEDVWTRLLASWIVFFALMGALNLYVAYNYSTDAWVNFKLFGGMGLMLAFVLLQALMLARYVHDGSAPSTSKKFTAGPQGTTAAALAPIPVSDAKQDPVHGEFIPAGDDNAAFAKSVPISGAAEVAEQKNT